MGCSLVLAGFALLAGHLYIARSLTTGVLVFSGGLLVLGGRLISKSLTDEYLAATARAVSAFVSAWRGGGRS